MRAEACTTAPPMSFCFLVLTDCEERGSLRHACVTRSRHRGRALLKASQTTYDQRTERERSAPKGPLDCSYGWSAAEPVGKWFSFVSAPEGRRN